VTTAESTLRQPRCQKNWLKLTPAAGCTQFRWLAPTTANLAQLTVPVPPGFREVSAQG